MFGPFQTEPVTDFSDPANVAAFQAAIDLVRSRLGATYPNVIGGRDCTSANTFDSVDPSHNDTRIGTFQDGTVDDAEAALDAAWAAFPSWSATPVRERAAVLLRAAHGMRRRKHEFSAAMVLEAGKTWAEADGDTSEGIDFLEFYAREAVKWGAPQPTTPYPGESNTVEYIALGAGVVIPPWNFPVAIAAGMTAAPIVAGNTVVLKPAEQTPFTGWMVFNLLRDSGLPDGVVNYVNSADGAVVGGHLVTHPRTRFISFTGSKAVGCWIYAEAAKVRDGQKWLKRVVAEMGGKDAILVDSDADVDAAADGIVRAAFGFQGQKCSACSRALIHKDIYAAVEARVAAAARKITVGHPSQIASGMGAVIDGEAQARIQSYIEIGKGEGTLLAGGGEAPKGGHFVQATVFGEVSRDARIANEEIFGPVLTLIPVDSYEEGVEVFNNTDYGLTGSYFGRANIDDAKRRLHCGNLYINRKCTGALVDVQPFGGFNMSGTDTKAGGREHLLAFLQGKSICELL
jgi:1-pyrroline-5-carboxylate dehydrogenase